MEKLPNLEELENKQPVTLQDLENLVTSIDLRIVELGESTNPSELAFLVWKKDQIVKKIAKLKGESVSEKEETDFSIPKDSSYP